MSNMNFPKGRLNRSLWKSALLFTMVMILLNLGAAGSGFTDDRAQILKEFAQGNFTIAAKLISRAALREGVTKKETEWLVRQQATIDRIRLDFGKTREDVREKLTLYFSDLQDSQIADWEGSGHLEMRLIDGVPRYFNNAVANLFRLDPAAAVVRAKRDGVPAPSSLDATRLENTGAILKAGRSGETREWKRITVEFTLTVAADAVPAGEDISCWLPFPRESPPRQRRVTLLAAAPAAARRSPPACPHSSLYAVKKAVAGTPTVFSYRASFEVAGQWVAPERIAAQENAGAEVPAEFCREELPHVAFSPAVRKLAGDLAASESDPLKLIRRFYLWIDNHIPWASALEYSIVDSIPDYVIGQRHGDCGMKTFLLMSLARCQGIPVRWQSGWMLHPGNENLHDWCEIWYAGSGWVPLDMSFGAQKTAETALRDFYLTGIDSYRMIVNDGFAREFCPRKKHLRSEPFDFQRGEVEWARGNIYFDQWEYNLNVLSIEKIKR
jgi:hypothetical protein